MLINLKKNVETSPNSPNTRNIGLNEIRLGEFVVCSISVITNKIANIGRCVLSLVSNMTRVNIEIVTSARIEIGRVVNFRSAIDPITIRPVAIAPTRGSFKKMIRAIRPAMKTAMMSANIRYMSCWEYEDSMPVVIGGRLLMGSGSS